MRTIAVVNQSSLVTPAALAQAVRALQLQVTAHFAPVWGLLCTLFAAAAPQPGQESIYLLDNTDQADALGYHTADPKADQPVGYVFVKTTLDAGDAWTATLSHELLEQLADPWVCNTAIAPWQGRQAALAWEVADPVENDEYVINGVRVSNFILPGWFDPQLAAGTHVDYMNTLAGRPLTMSPGGYVAYTTDLTSWQQSFAERCPAHQRVLQRYSRRHRRATGQARKSARLAA